MVNAKKQNMETEPSDSKQYKGMHVYVDVYTDIRICLCTYSFVYRCAYTCRGGSVCIYTTYSIKSGSQNTHQYDDPQAGRKISCKREFSS